jgi:hypothetical protein
LQRSFPSSDGALVPVAVIYRFDYGLEEPPRCIPMTVRHVKEFQQLRAAIAPPAKEEAAA